MMGPPAITTPLPPASDFHHAAFSRIPTWVKEKLSPKAIETIKKVHHWVETECVPAEPIVKAQLEKYGRWKTPPLIMELREKAKKEGLFNLFLPRSFGELSPGLTNLEYSCCAEIMGRVYWAQMVGIQPVVSWIAILINTDNELPCSRHWQHGAARQILQ